MLGWLAGGAAQAQSSTYTISEIRVVGTQRIDPSTVNAYMQIKPGEVYDPARVDASLKSLFETGLFADITLRREGDALIVQVVENPIINRIAFEGNDRIKNDVLEKEVSLRPRVVYTRTKVQSDVQRVLDLYRRSGRFAATVEPKVIQLSENRVDLVFEIEEGEATGIRAINFIGNKEFPDSSLRGVVQTVESAFWRFLSSDDTYDPDRLSFDRELLRRFYLSEGYADFRVVSAVAELTGDLKDFVITFTIEEGPRYRFGDIDLVNKLGDVPPEELQATLITEKGEWYNADQVEQSVQGLSDKLGEEGFAFVEVRPRVKRNREALTLDITYEVSEGPRVYVERINITGNVRTLDKVVRREFTLAEGDAFDTAKLRRTRQRLNNLGYFSRVDINNTPGSTNDRTVIDVAVEEKSTGELSIGAGFSSTAGALGDISLRERNLLGRGQDLRLGLTVAVRQQQIDLSFTEPYFLNRELAAGFDAYMRTTDYSNVSSFEQKEQGVGLRAGYQMGPNLRHTARYTVSREEVNGVRSTASPVIRAQEGRYLTSSIGNELYYDRLNRRFNPTDGYFASYKLDVAGVGGSEKFLRNIVESSVYVPVFDTSLVASLRGRAGYVFSFDDAPVRISNRFYLGGDKLRGFRNAGVGPRDLVTDDSIGGRKFYSGTAEVSFPLGLPEEFDIRASVFSDFGSAWDIKDKFPNLADDSSLRASAGIGLSWASPFGPIRIDMARALMKENYDKTEFLSFNLGTRF